VEKKAPAGRRAPAAAGALSAPLSLLLLLLIEILALPYVSGFGHFLPALSIKSIDLIDFVHICARSSHRALCQSNKSHPIDHHSLLLHVCPGHSTTPNTGQASK